MKKALLFAWQLPQNLLGLFLIWLYHCKQDTDGVWITNGARFGVCLGDYIILYPGRSYMTVLHERGHRVQSRILGPLYLLVVGLPSALLNNRWDVWFHKNWTSTQRTKWYYSRFPEAWADRLGGVVRKY